MLPHIQEIVTLYDVDAMFFDGTYARTVCYGDACRERFAASSGGLSIPQDATDHNWRQYIAWTLQAYVELRQSICDAIHRHRPNVIVSFSWAYTQRQPETVPESTGALMADVFPNVTLGTLTYKADHQVAPEWRDPNFQDFTRPIITTCETGERAALAEKLHTHRAHLGPAKERTPLAYPSFNA